MLAAIAGSWLAMVVLRLLWRPYLGGPLNEMQQPPRQPSVNVDEMLDVGDDEGVDFVDVAVAAVDADVVPGQLRPKIGDFARDVDVVAAKPHVDVAMVPV